MTESTLQEAIQSGDCDAVRQLLDSAPELASGRNEQNISWVMLAMYVQQPLIAETLAEYKGELDVYEAVALGDAGRVRELLDGDGSLLETETPDGFRALHYAAFFGREGIASELMDRGATVAVAATNPMRVHPLHSAAATRRVDICRRLLDSGADPDARQHGGYTALMSAAMHGQLELVRLLLERGADRSLESDDGNTARDLADENGHDEVVALFDE